ncbi:hypothetical protein H9Q70_003164 [Fusarium xylarioides]|nr:hypothetical protein H9Q70_003164 [Fusarium xylarioides]KAG5779858.1 hypothetical protein H9Q73_006473 [Fusarium xylarioides]
MMLDEAEINSSCANTDCRRRIKPLLDALPCGGHALLIGGVDSNPEEILVVLDKLGFVDVKAADETASAQKGFDYDLAYLSTCARDNHHIALKA